MVAETRKRRLEASKKKAEPAAKRVKPNPAARELELITRVTELERENSRLQRRETLLHQKYKSEIALLKHDQQDEGDSESGTQPSPRKESQKIDLTDLSESRLVPHKKHKYTWLNKRPQNMRNFFFPDDVLKWICTFLSDDDLFKFRVVNLLFYGAFYNQHTKRIVNRFPGEEEPESPWEISRDFDAHRAMRLAGMGRKFPRVEFILTPIDLFPSWRDLQTLSPRFFPSLKSLYIAQAKKNISLKNFPQHPKLEAFYCPYYSTDDAKYINEEKYPKLSMIDLQSVQCEATLPPHKNIKEICFIACGSVGWAAITKKNFPNLVVVKKYRRHPIPPSVKKRFQREKIAIEENNLIDA